LTSPVMTEAHQARRRKNWSRIFNRVLLYAVLVILSFLFLTPLIYMFLTSLMPLSQIGTIPPQWIPNPVMWENYTKALDFWNFSRSFVNTVIITIFTVVGSLVSCTLVAYGFARLRFPGRDQLFVVLLASMMMPYAVTMVPLFVGFSKIGWVDTFLPLIVPTFFGNPFYVFLLRQFFRTIPYELSDAARIDGASEFGIFLRIMVPLSGPALTVVAILSFQNAWNDFLGPLIYLNKSEMHTLALGLYSFRAMPGQGSLFNEMMAASVLMVVPVLIIFAMFQRQFVQGVTMSGLKG
jgi:multiple sugar transport system permease protein